MNFDYFNVFYVVGKHKNITKASKELYTSQPAVTRTIKKLESEIGCPLFTRTKSGVEFTREGATLYKFVESSVMQISRGMDEIANSINSTKGTIKIGATSTALNDYLYNYLAQLSEEYPNMHFEISSSSNNKTLDKLRDKLIDIAVVSTPYHLPASTFKVIKLSTFKSVVVCGNKYKDLVGKKLSLKDLENYPLLTLSKDMQLREYLDKIFKEEHINFHPLVGTNSVSILMPLVISNMGLAIIPEPLARRFKDNPNFHVLNVDYEFPDREIHLLYDTAYALPLVVREFLKLIEK
jgi:DNA-binding transcriptional LysR family regulator